MAKPLTIEDIYKLFEKTNEKLEESRQEYDRRAAEADRRLAELDKASKHAVAVRAVDALTTRWGRFVEQLVEPAIVCFFQSREIDVTQVASRVRSHKQGLAM